MSRQKKDPNSITYWKAVRTVLPATFMAAPGVFTIDVLAMILSPLCYVLNMIVTQNLFDSVEKAVNADLAFSSVVLAAFITVGVHILAEILNGMCFYAGIPGGAKVNLTFNKRIHEKISRLAAINFENPDILDCINKAKDGAKNALSLYSSLSSLFLFYIPYVLALVFYLYHLRPLLVLSLVFIFIPLAASQLLKGTIFTKLIDKSVPLERKMDYYEKTMYHREFFKETRMLGIFGFIKNLYMDTFALFSREKWRASRNAMMIEASMQLLTLIGYFGVLYLLFDSLLGGYISVGAFAAIFASLGQIFYMIRVAFSRYFSNMMEGIGAIKNYVRFLNLPEYEGKDIELDYSNGISLKNVCFRYPGANEDAIRNVSIDLKPGETVALVGKNGAGKTTLVRLLTGILQPSDGDVKVGEISTCDVSMKSLFQKTSGIFQKFQKYKMSLLDNIIISNIGNKIDLEHVSLALRQSDIILDDKFPNSLDTMLSREFDGVDLSGGEWQRVSIARGLHRPCEFIVLDEPTSAIDPIEETKLYKKFVDVAKGKTTIIVTHRLGSTKIADRIIVLKNGEIDSMGNHGKLMAEGGLYAQMYNAQAKWYSEAKSL